MIAPVIIDMSAACQLGFAHADLYTGDDLPNAGARSVILPSADDRGARQALLPFALGRALDDALRSPALRFRPASTVITGTESVSGATMRILFRGRPGSVDFCAEHILGTPHFTQAPARGHPDSVFDVAVCDHPLADRRWFTARPALRALPWIGQRAALGTTWEQTLDGFPGALRNEIARLLRKHRFSVTFDAGTPARLDFYRQLYLPYVRHRFGADAVIRNERTFLRESRDQVLLQLRIDGELSAATLLGRHGEILSMGQSALALAHGLRDRSDVMDYFCLLLAQLLGCRWVDFGVSRAHLDDGVFRYKSKWCSTLVAPGPLKPDLRIRPLAATPATLGFLSRNGFIERRGSGFVVRRLCAGAAAAEAQADRAGRAAARAGLDAMLLAFPVSGDARDASGNASADLLARARERRSGVHAESSRRPVGADDAPRSASPGAASLRSDSLLSDSSQSASPRSASLPSTSPQSVSPRSASTRRARLVPLPASTDPLQIFSEHV